MRDLCGERGRLYRMELGVWGSGGRDTIEEKTEQNAVIHRLDTECSAYAVCIIRQFADMDQSKNDNGGCKKELSDSDQTETM